MKEFQGRSAVITGAASGIGRALAHGAAGRGMNVVLADVDAAALARVADEFGRAQGSVITHRTDVSLWDDVEGLARRLEDELGGADLVFNNAGVLLTGQVWTHSLADWRWLLGVNLWGVVHGIQAFVPRMLAQGREGWIVNTGSVAGLLAAPPAGLYSVSKHAVVALSETLYHELAAIGADLGVSVICPGPVRTQIADSERNRAREEGAAPSSEMAAFQEALRKGIEQNGMDPAMLADQVFEAIEHRSFWVLPHDEFMAPLRARTESLLARRNPVYDPMMDV